MSKLAALKASLLADSATEAKACARNVLVNQRHLIDKILARYSAEFTVFRELLQNSNDAGAESAQIVFLTNKEESSRPTLLLFPWSRAATVQTVIYKNNGRPFSDEDFARLRKIAEGNPDEQKIGFFGVGFYSLFSLCEEPFVSSGDKSMAFLWKDDMLLTKTGRVPAEEVSEWTTFYMDMRDPIEVPKTDEFAKFLATSLAFTQSLKSVEVFVDDKRILHFHKKGSEPRMIEIPDKRALTLTSPNNTFKLTGVAVSKVQLDVEVDSKRKTDNYTIFMHISTASLGVTLPRKLADEMKRTTKKNPPATTELRLMFSNYDEYEGSSNVRGVTIFDSLIPGPREQGHIFIGFPTHQTTGCAIQLAGHLIPTVERESIDFVDRTLSYWNQELLAMGGLLARIVYETDLSGIETLYEQMTLDAQSRTWLESKAVHTMVSFTPKASTPSPHVGTIVARAFFGMSASPLRIVSNRGIRPADAVRAPVAGMLAFIRTTPLLPESAVAECKELVAFLQSKGHIRPLGVPDVLRELGEHPRTTDEAVALIKWLAGQMRNPARPVAGTEAGQIQQLLVVEDPASEPGSTAAVVRFARMTHYARPGLVSPDQPLPETVVPLSIGKHLSREDLVDAFPTLRELTAPDWIAFVIRHKDFGVDAVFTERAMATVSRHYLAASDANRARMVSMLAATACVPTQFGPRVPAQSYFPTVTMFKDLPRVALTNPRSVADQLLKALGVREHVELQMVFDRLNDLNWDQVQLIKYLASVQTKLTDVEVSRLRATPMFVREPPLAESAAQPNGAPGAASAWFTAAQLYAPSDALRAFDMPILKWAGRWRAGSDEARLMTRLGLREHVPVDELVRQAAAAKDPKRRMDWLKYFIEHHELTYKRSYAAFNITTPFLPTAGTPTGEPLAVPSACFTDAAAAVMGFRILHPDLKPHADKFGVELAPGPAALLERLRVAPPGVDDAAAVFTFLASRQATFSRGDWAALRNMRFIPVKARDGSSSGDAGGGGGGSVQHVAPSVVYFESQEGTPLAMFTYIDFGATANAFLRACGVKDQPSPLELAQSLVRDPQAFLDASGIETYLSLLRQVAANYSSVRQNSTLLKQMRASAFLVGVQPAAASGGGGGDGDADGPGSNGGGADPTSEADEAQRFTLAKASEIYLVDDTVLSQIFRPLCAPMEDLLESMYHDLGSQWLSQHVELTHAPKGTPTSTAAATRLQEVIQERAVLLLYDGQQMRGSRDLQSGAEATLKALRVLQVQAIDIVRVFGRVSRSQRTTSCTAVSSRTREVLLLITADYDYFDVASALGKIVLKKPRLNDALLLSTLLSTSIENLNRKGFPVDRILNLRASKLKVAANAVLDRKASPASTPTQSRTQLQTPTQPQSQSQSQSQMQTPKTPPGHEQALQNLQSVFPDADPRFLLQQLQALGPARVQEIAARLAETGYPTAPAAKNGSSGSGSGTDKKTTPATQTQTPSSLSSSSSSITKTAPDPPPSDDLFGMINKFTGMDIKKFGVDGITSLFSSSSTLGTPQTQTPTTLAGAGGSGPPGEITRRQTELLKTHLQNAIATTRGTNAGSIQSQVARDAPTPPTPLQQVQSRCGVLTEHDLALVARVEGVPVYVDRAVLEAGTRVVQETHARGVRRFVAVLGLVARVFGLAPAAAAVHVYWDKDGATIAFNRDRALFFNLRFYLGLHFDAEADARGIVAAAAAATSVGGGGVSMPGAFPGSGGTGTVAPADAPVLLQHDKAPTFFYWFMTFCHELAHNFVGEHNSQHEYWMSSFAETYLLALVAAMQREGISFSE